MKSQVFIGRGTMVKFKEDYDALNNVEGQKAFASSIFLLGVLTKNSTNEEDFEYKYDYAIFYGPEYSSTSVPVQPKPKPEVKVPELVM